MNTERGRYLVLAEVPKSAGHLAVGNHEKKNTYELAPADTIGEALDIAEEADRIYGSAGFVHRVLEVATGVFHTRASGAADLGYVA